MSAGVKLATLDLLLWNEGVDLPVNASLPWNHQEPLCEPPFPQVALDRKGRSYRFSFDEVMGSRTSHVPIAAGSSHHLRAEIANSRASAYHPRTDAFSFGG
jgi:hypothetical protein